MLQTMRENNNYAYLRLYITGHKAPAGAQTPHLSPSSGRSTHASRLRCQLSARAASQSLRFLTS